ncbi:MAG: hypothetical protein P8J22_02745 [Pseudomonadales bacterium]|nr:hypothetical protein [Pseudomonadales bacterium]|tara:strand:- start:34 stop:189 length:156 start_codon:yes stop_codon:yes gene_type:complete
MTVAKDSENIAKLLDLSMARVTCCEEKSAWRWLPAMFGGHLKLECGHGDVS